MKYRGFLLWDVSTKAAHQCTTAVQTPYSTRHGVNWVSFMYFITLSLFKSSLALTPWINHNSLTMGRAVLALIWSAWQCNACSHHLPCQMHSPRLVAGASTNSASRLLTALEGDGLTAAEGQSSELQGGWGSVGKNLVESVSKESIALFRASFLSNFMDFWLS